MTKIKYISKLISEPEEITGVICKVWPNGCPHPELCQDKCFDDDIKREKEYNDNGPERIRLGQEEDSDDQ